MLNSLKAMRRLHQREPDERIVAESNRVYKTGCWLLVVGLGLYFWYSMMLDQVAFVNDLQPATSRRVDPVLSTWFMLVLVAVAVMLQRKGVYSFEPFDDDVFPVECCLTSSFGIATAVFVLATFMRAIAEFELLGAEGVNWLDDAVIASVYAAMVFAVALAVFGMTYVSAKRRRARLEAELDD